MTKSTQMQQLLDTLPQTGKVEWISIRPGRGERVTELETVHVSIEKGLEGDRYGGRPGSPRQVTLIQQEHLAAVGGMLGRGPIEAAIARRNIVVSGINLLALKGKQFKMGDAILEYTGLCHPCSKMEAAFGPGGYNAMRGHGGITAKVIQGGSVSLGDFVRYHPPR